MSERYGPLATPETQPRIEVIEDPVRIARSAYQTWLPIVRQSGFIVERWGSYGPQMAEMLYQEAVQRLAPSAEAFAHPTPRTLDTIISAVPDTYTAGGLFLSALLNATKLDWMDGVFKHHILGYRLAPGKTLIARKGSDTTDLGTQAAGTLINLGRTSRIAYYATGGVQVNYAQADSVAAWETQSGIQLNYGRITSGACMNWGNGAVQADYCKPEKRYREVHIGKTRYDRWTSRPWIPHEHKQELGKLGERLVQKFEDVRLLPRKGITALREYDWTAFSTDVHRIAGRIKELDP